MKHRAWLLIAFFGVVLLAGAASILLLINRAAPGQPALKPQPAEVQKAAATNVVGQIPINNLQAPTLALVPGSTLEPVPTPFPPAQWSAVPPCANQPEAVDTLAQSLTAATGAGSAIDTDLRRAGLLSPKLAQWKAAQVNSLLIDKTPEMTAYGQRTFVALAVNIATGRLNRATEISFPSLPDVKTTGDLFDRLEGVLSGEAVSPALIQAGKAVLDGQGITQPVCAHLLITRSGNQSADLRWTAKGVQALGGPIQGIKSAQANQLPTAIDTITASPDGRTGAFTSLSNDSGGPVYLMNLASGAWTNLIEKMSANRAEGQPALPVSAFWDVIGWLPDSQRLAIGPADLSAVFVVDINTGKFTTIPFNGGGLGGGMFVGLAPDGSQFAYITSLNTGDAETLSLYDFASGQSKEILRLGQADGTIAYPRYAPDGKSLAYVVQKGSPDTGYRYSINLYSLEKGSAAVLVEGNLGLSVPTWSPDGQYLAYTRKSKDEPDKFNPANPLEQPGANVWTLALATGKTQQVTFVQGQARRPMWASDAKSISFITHDGQIGLVNLDQPGQMWHLADTSTQAPEFTSAAFIP